MNKSNTNKQRRDELYRPVVYSFQYYFDGPMAVARGIEIRTLEVSRETVATLQQAVRVSLLELFGGTPTKHFIVPLPKREISGQALLQVPVPLEFALPHILFACRRRHNLLKKDVSALLGLATIEAYSKFEHSPAPIPRPKTLLRLREIFPEFPI